MKVILQLILLLGCAATANSQASVVKEVKPKEFIIRQETIPNPPPTIDTIKISRPSSNKGESQGFSLSEIVGILTNISTIIVAFLTYLLLKETKKTIDHGYSMADRDRRRLEAETINTIYSNFRETYMFILSDEIGINLLAESWKLEHNKIKINLYSSFLINNIHEIYNLKITGFLSEEVWKNYLLDITTFINLPFMVSRWRTIGKNYPHGFQSFVNDLIIKNEGEQK